MVLAGLLTPLPFTQHRLRFPWPLLLPVCTFFKMEGGDSQFAKFTLLTLKAILKARCQNVSGNKQQLVARAVGCPRMYFVHKLVIFWSARKQCKDTFFPPSITVPHVSLTATVAAFVLLGNSGLNFYCYTQHEPTPTHKLARK